MGRIPPVAISFSLFENYNEFQRDRLAMRVLVVFLALLAVGLHAWLSFQLRLDGQQALLGEAAGRVLGDEDLGLEFDHLDGRLAGGTDEAAARVREALPVGRIRIEEAGPLEGLPVVRLDPSSEEPEPETKPVRLNVGVEGDGLVLGGRLGSADAVEELVAALEEVVDGTVTPEVEVDPAVEEAGWFSGLDEFFPAYFGTVEGGRFELEASTIRLAGQLPASLGTDWGRTLIQRHLGDDFEVLDELELVPDLAPSLRLALEEGTLSVSGRLAVAEGLAALRDRAAERGLDWARGELEVSPAVRPFGTEDIPMDLLETWVRSAIDGTLEVEEQRVVLRGRVDRAANRSALEALSRSWLGDGGDLEVALSVEPSLPADVVFLDTGEALEVRGKLPTEEAIEALEASLEAAGLTALENELRVDADVRRPQWPDGMADFVAEFAQSTDEGEVHWLSQSLRLAGKVRREAGKVALLERAGGLLPEGATLIDELVVDPQMAMPDPPAVPRTLEPVLAVRVASDGGSVEGTLGFEKEREVLRDAMKAVWKGKAGTEGVDVGADRKALPWLEGLMGTLPQLRQGIEEGTLRVEGSQRLLLEGTAVSEASRDQLLSKLASVAPEGVEIQDQLRVSARPEPLPEDVASEVFTIFYRTGSTYINLDGQEQVRRAAEAIQALDGSSGPVLIKGFADVRGDAEANQILSRLRAKEVFRQLGRQGISTDRLRFIGVGESEARKGSSESVWKKDRRVEIVLVPGQGSQ